ncbi:transcription factor bHLH95-like [Durio zibethinus]|uniref:Transcription factor bHLH95-like n=1 Tax=Durio zibethinus TaxID=66656 RepID=A0A6P6AEV1_DURZI|nr:transcription factor bHLH95-like [Durio zibethinus]
MSEEGGHESFLLLENQSWALSNSDNNSTGTGAGSDEKSGKNQQEQETLQDETEKNNKRELGGGGEKNGKGGGGGGESDDHEMHIWTERERRKKMRNMFSNLHALLPQLPPKADKSTIVDEAVNYIETLQQTLQKLRKQKLERLQGSNHVGYEPSSMMNNQKQAFDLCREAFLADQVSSSDPTIFSNSLLVSQFPVLFQTWTSSNVVLNLCGNEAQISVCSPKKPGLFTTICYILEKHKIEVISAHVSSDSNQSMFMIQAHASGASNQLSAAFQVEEMFKQAAAEIMCCVSS